MLNPLRQKLDEARDKLFPRPCARKRRYPSAAEARAVMIPRQRRSKVKLYIYRCPHRNCKGWHITRMQQPTTEERKD